ncbi:mitomycin radical oxidase [Corynespora cassiicola Philippines]|uniref:Mitomycin radical oxidase n=1 Tax=Corynespora cassiicola Philippines TaxID=1448308 RepID=A0A2T2NCY9_CORCC|nr:mitomycin radical oxidase [Corynespora cassiicola Philippines]
MRIRREEITSFMLSLGLMHNQVSQVHERAQVRWNYTEELLSAVFPDNVLLPSNPEYPDSISKYFGSRARLNASAVFVPVSPEQVAIGVRIMEAFDRQFAVRGNGHTSHPGMAGIEDGVLFSLEKMDNIVLAPSRKVVSLGAGNYWGRVYETLESEGVAVTGGQLAPVGVSGLLTGNGLSNFLSSRGFSSADVVNFEIVLSGGNIVNANATHNEDLWWALKGGANNFGIVTRFDMNTFPLPDGIWSGTLSYDPSQASAVGETFYNIQAGALVEHPQIDPLWDAGPVSVNASRKTLTDSATQDVTPEFLASYTKRLVVNRANLQVKANREVYRELAGLLSEHYQSSSISGHILAVTWNSVTPHAIRESNRKGGNPGGWQEISQNSINFRSIWDNATDDATAIEMDKDFMSKLEDVARKWDSLLPNQWMNNAAEDVDVIGSYGKENLKKLRLVSKTYDRRQTFQKLCSGGYKLNL